MKIIFEEGDGKFLEQAIYRGLDRVLRGLARDNLFQSAGKPAEQVSVAEEESRVDREWLITETRSGPHGAERDERRVTARSLTEAIKEARRLRGWGGRPTKTEELALPLFGREAPERPVNLPPGFQPAQPLAAAPPPAPSVESERKRKERVKWHEILKTVGPRPAGFIARDDAVALIGGCETDKQTLNKWIASGEVSAMICASMGKTKGLPGTIVVHKQTLVARNEHRKANAAVTPHLRTKYVAPSHVNGANGAEHHADA